jgi:hypothetical protein
MYGLVVVAVLHLGGGGLGSERLGRVVGRMQANKEVVDEQRALVPQFLLSPPSLAPASPDARGPREGAGMGARSWGTAAGSDTSTDGSRQKHLSDHGDGQIHRVLKEAAVQCWDQPSALVVGSCWDRPSVFAGIDRWLLLGSTVGFCWDRTQAAR